MQRHFFAPDMVLFQLLEHRLGEMQTRSRGCHRAFYFRVNRLIGCLVTLLRLPFQVRRNGQYAAIVQDVGKAYVGVFPREVDVDGAVVLAFAFRFQQHLFAPHLNLFGQRTFFPFLCVAQHTLPYTVLLRLKGQRVVGWLAGAETKNLDVGSCLLMEQQPGLYHLGIVENHQQVFGQVVADVAEYIFPNFALLINQQFGRIPLFQWKFGDALIGQIVAVVLYRDVLWMYH